MLSKFKKTVFVSLIFVFCLSFTTFAESTVSLTPPEGFFIHEKSPEKVAQIIGMEPTELNEYCANNSILYLAVDGNNSRQIRATVSENGFSNKIVNISQLTDDKISSLAPDIAGIEGVRGSVVKKNSQKFLRIQLKSEDSGGEYILTQYITVAKRQNFVLSFYNNADVDADYIDEVFESLDSTMFEDTASSEDSDKDDEKINLFLIIIPIITIAFVLICIGLGVSVVIEIKRSKEDDRYEEESDLDSYDETVTNDSENIPTDNEND